MGQLERDIEIRTKLLTIIEECDKKLGFCGDRGEQWFNTTQLQELAEELISQLPEESEVNNVL